MSKKDLPYQLVILILSALIFMPFLGRVHLFDWDEINFAESAREMIVTNDYLTVRVGYEPFWEKPPLFIWLQVLSMKIFGINEYAARFPNAVCGVVTLLLLFNIGRIIHNSRFGLIWVLAYAGSVLPFIYFKSGIIDPWFNLFIFISIICWFYTAFSKRKYLLTFLSALFLGLAVLTKGPVSVIIFGILFIFLLFFREFRKTFTWKQFILFAFTLLITGGFWFILQIMNGNFSIIKDFIVYQIRLFKTRDAGHGGFPLYHFVIILVGVFPASVFAIAGHKFNNLTGNNRLLHISMIVLLWSVLILFSIVKTKIIHYSSLAYFPLTYLGGYAITEIIDNKRNYTLWLKILTFFIGSIFAMLSIALPWLYMYRDHFIEKGYITDPFVIGNLQAETGWGWYISLAGVLLISALSAAMFIHRKQRARSFVIILCSTMIFTLSCILMITKGAEKISQNAAIEFISDKAGKDVYLKTFYKSYATLFYGKQELPVNSKAFDLNWLLEGDIDKDAYFIHKIHKKEEILSKYPGLEFLYEKNGYIFFKRQVVKKLTINDQK